MLVPRKKKSDFKPSCRRYKVVHATLTLICRGVSDGNDLLAKIYQLLRSRILCGARFDFTSAGTWSSGVFPTTSCTASLVNNSNDGQELIFRVNGSEPCSRVLIYLSKSYFQ
jgi:hypothetical protein